MIDNFANNGDKSGVSPVIGVILMIAITVILGAVIGFYAVELGGSTSSNVNAGIQTEETSDGVEVRWTSSGNAERVYVLVNGSEVDGAELSGVGGSMTVSAGENDTVSVVGVDADGNETELQSVTTESDTTGDSGEPQLVSGGSSDSGSGPSEPNSESGSVTVSNLEGDGSSSNPYVITNDQELQAMNQDLDANYILGNDIDASLTNEWNSGSGFKPVGSNDASFTGSLNGDGYTITGLYSNRTSSEYVGLFGVIRGSSVTNLRMETVDISGDRAVGGLSGKTVESSTVDNIYVSGSVTSTSFGGGGLVGLQTNSTIQGSTADVDVNGDGNTGGLVGDSEESEIIESDAHGPVTGQKGVGGLVGRLDNASVKRSYAEGSVDANGDEIGGLAGDVLYGTITNSYAEGDVIGSQYVGGLVGNSAYGDVTTSYSVGSVSAEDSNSGGLIGYNFSASTSDSYWDTGSSGQSSSEGGTGLMSSEMLGDNAEQNMDGFDFGSTWKTVGGDYPISRGRTN